MKTIWDAVNELKGDWKFRSDFICAATGSSVAYNKDDIYPSGSIDVNSWFYHICTKEEFNALVTEMSLGLDVNPINEGYYHKYLDADKQELKPIKQEPNIYTQEMCDNGELPPIGSMFIDIELNNEEQVEAMAHDLPLGRVIYKRGSTLQDSEYFGAQAHECKPIPPKLELIDGEAYQFDIDSLVVNGIYRKMDNKFYNYSGDFGVEYCNNIKPLTVSD